MNTVMTEPRTGKYELVNECQVALAGPLSVTFDGNGDILIVEEFGHSVKKFNKAFECLTIIGNKGTGNAEFIYPTDVAIDEKNNIYITDRWNHRVQKFDTNGQFVMAFGSYGTGKGEFCEPWGISMADAETLAVVDKGNARIVFFDNAAQVVKTYGKCGPSIEYYEGAEFKQNYHYRRWISDLSRLWTVESNFQQLKYEIGTLEYPEKVCFDTNYNCYVSDRVNGRVVCFNGKGHVIKNYSKHKNSYFPSEPSSIHVGMDNYLFIGEESTGKVYMIGDEVEEIFDFSCIDMAVSDFAFNASGDEIAICDAWRNRVGIFQFKR